MQPTLDSFGYLNIVADNFGKLTLKVLDTNGRIAKRIYEDVLEGCQKLDLKLNELSSGTYVLNAFHGDVFVKSFRFTKQ